MAPSYALGSPTAQQLSLHFNIRKKMQITRAQSTRLSASSSFPLLSLSFSLSLSPPKVKLATALNDSINVVVYMHVVHEHYF